MKLKPIICKGILFLFMISCFVFAAELSALRVEQNQAIADIRMGDLSVLVTDVDGSSGPGASVKFEQQEHDFRLGNAFNLSAFTSNKYLDTMEAYFNHGVHQWEFEWDETEPRDGNVTFEYADRVLAWAKSVGIDMRAHAFAWGVSGNVPNYQSSMSESELRAEMLERVWDIYNHYGDTSYTDYDIINEMCPGKFYQNNAGWQGVADMYALADSLFTGEVYVNEYEIIDGGSYVNPLNKIIDSIEAHGGVVQGVGMQAHVIMNADQEDNQYALDNFWDRYQIRCKLTEAIFGGNDNTQANNLESVFRTAFAHTSVDGIVMWGVWRGGMTYSLDNHWWDSNWNPRPIVQRYKDLMFDEWWSEEENETTGNNGVATGDVFYGTYKITVTAPGDAETKVVNAAMTRREGSKQIEVQLDGEYWTTEVVSEKPAAKLTGLQVSALAKSNCVEFTVPNGNAYHTQFTVYNIKGEKVWSKKVRNQYKIRWDLNGGRAVSNGAYFVKVDNGKQQVRKRFVIAR